MTKNQSKFLYFKDLSKKHTIDLYGVQMFRSSSMLRYILKKQTSFILDVMP